MEEGALLLPDVDEGRLDAGEDRLDPAEVDVADGAAVIGPVDQELDQPVVFQDGHAGFPLAPVDQDLTLQTGPPQPPRARTACPAACNVRHATVAHPRRSAAAACERASSSPTDTWTHALSA